MSCINLFLKQKRLESLFCRIVITFLEQYQMPSNVSRRCIVSGSEGWLMWALMM